MFNSHSFTSLMLDTLSLCFITEFFSIQFPLHSVHFPDIPNSCFLWQTLISYNRLPTIHCLPSFEHFSIHYPTFSKKCINVCKLLSFSTIYVQLAIFSSNFAYQAVILLFDILILRTILLLNHRINPAFATKEVGFLANNSALSIYKNACIFVFPANTAHCSHKHSLFIHKHINNQGENI